VTKASLRLPSAQASGIARARSRFVIPLLAEVPAWRARRVALSKPLVTDGSALGEDIGRSD
jgi:hypothetical protein